MGVKRSIIGLVAAVFFFTTGFMVHGWLDTPMNNSPKDNHQYPLLAKRLFVNNPNDPIINFVSLRQQLTNYFQQNNLTGSLYFEYLPTGTSVRIDGDDQSVAASLMKLPAAMDAYKAVEEGKVSLNKVITLQPSWLDSDYGDLYQKGAGYQLTLRQAIQILLEKSDNTALKAVTLTTFGMVKPADSSLNAVDVDLTQNPDLTVSIGARSYSSFLKCLYFACYNNYQDSQSILDDLAHTPFKTRLLGGITDSGVTVAHKIGVANNTQSDCGIIYLPNRNYLLCAMLHGDDNSSTDTYIAALSKLAYQYVKQK